MASTLFNRHNFFFFKDISFSHYMSSIDMSYINMSSINIQGDNEITVLIETCLVCCWGPEDVPF